MTILEYILLAIGIIIVAPILAFLCLKLGTVGYFRGKEASNRKIDVKTVEDKKRKTENFD